MVCLDPRSDQVRPTDPLQLCWDLLEIKIGMITTVHADELKFLGVPAVRPTLDHTDRPAAQDYHPSQRGLVDAPYGCPSGEAGVRALRPGGPVHLRHGYALYGAEMATRSAMTILSHAKAAFLADSSRHSVVRGTSVFIVPLARHQVLTLQGVSSGAASLGATCVVVKAERAHDRRSTPLASVSQQTQIVLVALEPFWSRGSSIRSPGNDPRLRMASERWSRRARASVSPAARREWRCQRGLTVPRDGQACGYLAGARPGPAEQGS